MFVAECIPAPCTYTRRHAGRGATEGLMAHRGRGVGLGQTHPPASSSRATLCSVLETFLQAVAPPVARAIAQAGLGRAPEAEGEKAAGEGWG